MVSKESLYNERSGETSWRRIDDDEILLDVEASCPDFAPIRKELA